ncbi:MAG: Hsp20/alpha crystallin family protein [Anaerolineales bacterium]|nr:Hsp20/alpha crystallin family protein [Anaerolineales bacterium]
MMYRRYRTPSIWREMTQLQNEMNRLFEDYSPRHQRTAPGFPAMNVWADENSVLITAEVPGIDPKEIDVNVLGDTLTVSGSRMPDDLPEDVRYHRRERGYGKFSRSMRLPYTVDVKNVDAKFKNGVLNITLPRAEADKPKKITVKSS